LWENVTFGLPFNAGKFERVMKACALEEDLKKFPDGMNTEIGERGVTLSGGQNQRLSLARACYAAEEGDLVLCDDVLSALDTSVAADIYRDVLSSDTGMLWNTTRVVATHALWTTTEADVILNLSSVECVGGAASIAGVRQVARKGSSSDSSSSNSSSNRSSNSNSEKEEVHSEEMSATTTEDVVVTEVVAESE
jgi:ABC-type transport system involved in cytochrome bd biosynthesis fused ATPase/permease subunit